MSVIYRIYRNKKIDNNIYSNLCSIVYQNIKFDFYMDENGLNLITFDQNLPRVIKLKFQSGNKTRVYVFEEDKNKYPKKKPEITVRDLYTRFMNDIYIILSPNYFGSYKKELNSFIISQHYLGPLKVEDIYEKL